MNRLVKQKTFYRKNKNKNNNDNTIYTGSGQSSRNHEGNEITLGLTMLDCKVKTHVPDPEDWTLMLPDPITGFGRCRIQKLDLTLSDRWVQSGTQKDRPTRNVKAMSKSRFGI